MKKWTVLIVGTLVFLGIVHYLENVEIEEYKPYEDWSNVNTTINKLWNEVLISTANTTGISPLNVTISSTLNLINDTIQNSEVSYPEFVLLNSTLDNPWPPLNVTISYKWFTYIYRWELGEIIFDFGDFLILKSWDFGFYKIYNRNDVFLKTMIQ